MRSTLEFHPQNPRMIDKHAMSKLVKTLKKNKLVSPLQVNERVEEDGWEGDDCGKLVVVGGNQRMEALDRITKYNPETGENDYEIPISVIRRDAKREYEILIALNNLAIQGMYDYALLEDMFSGHKIDLEATGFERIDLAVHFDAGILDELVGASVDRQAAEESSVLKDMQETKATGKEAEKAKKAAEKTPEFDEELLGDNIERPEKIPYVKPTPKESVNIEFDQQPEESFEETVDKEYEKRTEMQARKQEYRDGVAEEFSNDYYLVMIAETTDQMKKFLRYLELDEETQFFSLNQVLEALGIDLEG